MFQHWSHDQCQLSSTIVSMFSHHHFPRLYLERHMICLISLIFKILVSRFQCCQIFICDILLYHQCIWIFLINTPIASLISILLPILSSFQSSWEIWQDIFQHIAQLYPDILAPKAKQHSKSLFLRNFLLPLSQGSCSKLFQTKHTCFIWFLIIFL